MKSSEFQISSRFCAAGSLRVVAPLRTQASLQWRRDFIQTCLERDIPLFGFQVASEQLAQFWRMLANDQGELFNAQRDAKSMGISGHTIARFVELLEQLLLVRRLAPWSVNAGKRLVERYNEIRPNDALGSLPPAQYRRPLIAAETLLQNCLLDG